MARPVWPRRAQAIVDTHREHAELLSSVREDLRSRSLTPCHSPYAHSVAHAGVIHIGAVRMQRTHGACTRPHNAHTTRTTHNAHTHMCSSYKINVSAGDKRQDALLRERASIHGSEKLVDQVLA